MELLIILLIPAIAAALSPILKRKQAAALTVVGNAVVLGLAALVAERVIVSGSAVAFEGWLSTDALGALILVLVAFVGLTSALFSSGYMGGHQASEGTARRNYYSLFNLFLLSMLAVPVLANIALVWIAVALTTLSSAFLVAYEDTPEALEAAWKYVILTTIGAVIALLGILFLYWGTHLAGGGAFTWDGLLAAAPQIPPPVLWLGFLLVLVGFGTKAGLAPMHTWLPDAHSQAPAPVCALLSGVETSTALYVVLRLFPVLESAPGTQAGTWFMVIGLFSVGVAALLLVYVRDYKRMFAFSTIEHMGIIMVAAGLGGAAHFGVVFQIVTHALTKSFSFYAAGAVLLATGSQEISSVRGLVQTAPVTAMALLFGALAIAGAPPFAVFMSEFTIIKAGMDSGQYLVIGLLALFIVIAFCAMMLHVNRMVFGPASHAKPVTVLPLSSLAALALAATPILILGIYLPGPLHRLLAAAAMTLGVSP